MVEWWKGIFKYKVAVLVLRQHWTISCVSNFEGFPDLSEYPFLILREHLLWASLNEKSGYVYSFKVQTTKYKLPQVNWHLIFFENSTFFFVLLTVWTVRQNLRLKYQQLLFARSSNLNSIDANFGKNFHYYFWKLMFLWI